MAPPAEQGIAPGGGEQGQLPWPGPKPPPKGLDPRVWLYIGILFATFVLALWIGIWWSTRGGDSLERSRTLEYAASLEEAGRLLRDGDGGKAAAILKAREDFPGRGWEWGYLTKKAEGAPAERTVVRLEQPIALEDVGWIAEGDRLILRFDRGIQLRDSESGQVLQAISLVETEDQIAIPAAAGWKMIALRGAMHTVEVRNLGGGPVEDVELGLQADPIHSAAISGSGSLLATASIAPSHEFVIWDLVTKKARVRARNIKTSALAWEPQGRGVLIGTEEGRVVCYRGTPWRVQFQMDAHPGKVVDVAACPDGHSFATAGADGEVRIWDNWGRRISEIVREEGRGDPTDLAYTPDGLRLAIARSDGGVQVIDAKTGISLLSIPPPAGGSGDSGRRARLRFDPAGGRLLVADGREIRIFGEGTPPGAEPALTAP